MLSDESPMRFGKHKGKQLKDIPRNYWIFLYDRGWLKDELLEWAKKNHPILKLWKEKELRNGYMR